MNYFYMHPNRKQYYFPENVFEYRFLLSFYTPYSLLGKILWKGYKNLPWLRAFFSITEDELPEKALLAKKMIERKKCVLAFNLGTSGIEQKMTILGYDIKKQEKFFIKFSERNATHKLVKNEYEVLISIEDSGFTPMVKSFSKKSGFLLLETSFVGGKKLEKTTFSKGLLTLLEKVKSTEPKLSENRFGNRFDLKFVFAHGDFCPWNILINNNEYWLIDWEMGGYYPAGYDLFTFIFQTNFLLNPEKKIDKIIDENKAFIRAYFSNLRINDWRKYLSAFTEIKMVKEKGKKNNLFKKYYQLKIFSNG